MRNQISPNPAAGRIDFNQISDTTPYPVLTTGILVPMFVGTGAPSATTLVEDGGGSEAYYRLYSQYLDITTPTAPTLWICTTAGSKSASVWAQVSGGGGFMGEYDPTKSYAAGQAVKKSTQTTIAGVVSIAGYYGVPPAGTDVNGQVWSGVVPAAPTGNNVPQFPLPAGTCAAELIYPLCTP